MRFVTVALMLVCAPVQAQPIEVAGIDEAVSLDVDPHQACVVRRNGALYCWGRSTRAPRSRRDVLSRPRSIALEPRDALPRDFAAPETVLEARAGLPTCARTQSGWWCLYERWEHDRTIGGTVPGWLERLHAPPMRQVADTCGVDHSGRLYCASDPIFGTERMAYRSFVEIDPSERFLQTTQMFAFRGQPTVCGVTSSHGARCYQPPRSIDEPSIAAIANVVQLEAEGSLACALTREGTVYCWGEHAVRTEGLPRAVEIGVGGRYACARTEAGRIHCWAGDGDRDALSDREPWPG